MRVLRTAGSVNSPLDGGQPATGADGNEPARSRSLFAVAFSTLLPALWLLLAWMVVFQLLRVLLVVVTWSHHGEATMSLIGQSLLRGVRFDLAIAAWLVLPFAFWWIWRGTPGRRERRFVFGGFPPSASDDLSVANPERTASLACNLDAFVVTGLNTIERRLAATQRQ